MLAHTENRNDAGMMQTRRRFRLALEALASSRIEQNLLWQDLERDVPAQRDLFGLVDDPHPAPAHLAKNPKISQLLERRQRTAPRRKLLGRFPALLHFDKGGEKL